MHAAPFQSVPQLVARLTAKRQHAERRPQTKPEQRRFKQAKREDRAELVAAFR